jgi:hypothetical protein
LSYPTDDADPDDPAGAFRDRTAAAREHSYVNSETWAKIGKAFAAAVAGKEGARTPDVARQIVERLSSTELEEIVCDWIEGRGGAA